MASQISGRPIEYVVPEEVLTPEGAAGSDVEKAQASEWIGPFSIAQLKSFEYAVRDGYYAICTRHVQMITKRPAAYLSDAFRANRNLLAAPSNV